MNDAPAREAAPPLDREDIVTFLEALLVVTFLLVYIWIIEPRSRAYAAPGFVLFFAFAFLLHVRHNDTAADLGIRFDTFGRALREAFIVIVPALILSAALGVALGGGVALNPQRTVLAFLWG